MKDIRSQLQQEIIRGMSPRELNDLAMRGCVRLSEAQQIIVEKFRQDQEERGHEPISIWSKPHQ